MNKYAITIPDTVFETAERASQIAVYGAMRSFAMNGKGECFASQRVIGEKAKCDKTTVKSAVTFWIKKGLMKVVGVNKGWRAGRDTEVIRFTDELGDSQPTQQNELGDFRHELGGRPSIIAKVKAKENKTASVRSSDTLFGEDSTVKEKDNAPIPNVTVSKESVPDQATGAESTPVDINNVIDLWKPINPLGYEKFFSNKTERQCVEDSVKVLGLEEYTKSLEQIVLTNKEEFSIQITTPYEFQMRYAKWVNKMGNKKEDIPDGMHFSVEKQKDVWYEGGRIIAEYEDDLQWQAFLKTKGENFVIPKKPADGVGYQPMSHEERMKKIESGEIKVWDF